MQKNSIPLRLPDLNMNGLTVELESSIKFLGVWMDENLTWRDHIHTVENNTVKKYWTHLISRKVLPQQELPHANPLCLHTGLTKLCKHSMGS